MLWRYSLRWGLPHMPCHGTFELAASEVPAGHPCPAALEALWNPAGGYVVCLNFQQAGTSLMRWSTEARARARRRNLAARLRRQGPLFADELFARETALPAAYFSGEGVHTQGGSDA